MSDYTATIILLAILILTSNGISYYTGRCRSLRDCIKKLEEGN